MDCRRGIWCGVCCVAEAKRIMPSVEDLWATRQSGGSPLSVGVAPAKRCAGDLRKAKTAEVRVGVTTQNIDQKITQNNSQSHTTSAISLA
jgi:hypothetical protein